MSLSPTPSPQPTGDPAQRDCGPQLKQLYPALFSHPPKPLKLRIQNDIQQRSPGLFTKAQLSAFLRRHTGSYIYLNALVKASHRYDLDGNPGDELSAEHRKAAIDELARRRAIRQSRQALEEEQRFNRATLLHDFERTTLTLPNFCALKGLPETELEPLLARARQEASEPRAHSLAFESPRRNVPAPSHGPRPPSRGKRAPHAARTERAGTARAPDSKPQKPETSS